MKFAFVNNEKIEAVRGEKGYCPFCGSELTARCGEIKVNHWAHKGKRICDPWWENETDWHRSWKNFFPVDCQETIQFSKDNEKHIADVKTQEGWVLEFQHSYLKPEERRSRNVFYQKLVWVVNGLRRKTDTPQFESILQDSTVITPRPHVRKINFPEECRLLKEWADERAFVFFDFHNGKVTKQSCLWFLFPMLSNREAYLAPFSHLKFIEMHNNGNFEDFVGNIILPIRNLLSSRSKNDRIVKGYGGATRLYPINGYKNGYRRRSRRF